MSRILVLSIIAASLSTIVGCGASSHATRSSISPAGSLNVAEARDEASWCPPEEGLQIREAKAPEAPVASEHERLKGSYRPNREQRPVSGAVHAATY